jgi:hypothetical protein
MRAFKHPLLLCVLLLFVHPVAAAPAAETVFQQRWRQHDELVATGQANRSWTWGPAPLTGVVQEYYQLPGSYASQTRDVQYYDKGRMEINEPEGDPNALWYVTSGRLPVDLMFATTNFRPNNRWKDAYITAIGDPGSFPSYLDLQPLYQSPGRPDPAQVNQPATDMLEPDLRITRFADYSADPATVLRQGLNEHLVPQALLDFMNQRGPVLRGTQRVNEQIYDPLYLFGLPVTPAVWVRAQVGGSVRPVLFQVFERRVLTYNPANPPAFRVEMGNVGAHYYDWLTNEASGREFDYNNASDSVVTARDPKVIYSIDVEVREVPYGAPGSGLTRPDSGVYRIYRSLDGGQTRELRHTGEIGPGCWTGVDARLLPPGSPQADPQRIGLELSCGPQSPSYGRGFGVSIYSSYDGATTFFTRGSD